MDIWEAGLEAQSRPASPRAPQPRWLDLLERTTRICADHERPGLVPVEDLAEWLDGAAGGDVLYAEIGLPRALLAGGLALIEATGVDWSDPAPAVAGIAALTRADTVLFVTEATRELSATELGVL